ncbi:Phage antitermination protein Q [Pseudomonas putida]|uniref:antiterminator Q family protein n=1 Tax=Pseudomonas guariconensis TaxID=1288410 RepID=UPI001FA177AF|nr:antiterminator Q family protein [Pseudomonas guariconensis]CAB5525914.1 Phage antitermination protein Q [Pseudomonas putida]MDM9595321.1 antiterminator Q family protein [Pseudomonas guariconensis]MDM9608151.1 antiterminator Q family protein [Pseudomonas guariconensis]MDM9613108.1 antiterminator Q family protein [Pseudomonas guariconensis]CAB5529933.1 Phage antitermination protein Q [Pseudomonas putida]
MKKRTYMDKPLGDTEYLLEQWGWWRMDGMGVPGYVSQMAAVMSQRNPVASSKSYNISDEVACVVDSAVARLIQRNAQMGDFIWLYFGAKWTMVRVGEYARMSERSAREVVKAGVGWIDCALEEIRTAA